MENKNTNWDQTTQNRKISAEQALFEKSNKNETKIFRPPTYINSPLNENKTEKKFSDTFKNAPNNLSIPKTNSGANEFMETKPKNGQLKKMVIPTIMVIIFIGIIAAVYFWQNSLVKSQEKEISDFENRLLDLKDKNTTLTREAEELNSEIINLKAKLKQAQAQPKEKLTTETTVYKNPKAGWKKYFPESQESLLKDKTAQEVKNAVGSSPIVLSDLASSEKKEMWIYFINGNSLMLYFKNGKLFKGEEKAFEGLNKTCPLMNF